MTALIAKKAAPVSTALKMLPQLVPSSACFTCEICCRFPDPDSALRPYFTGEEIVRAVGHGLDMGAFSDAGGSQVALVPDATGEAFRCPAFNAETGACGVYEQRPLDCQVYPLALMWDADHRAVVLGWDRKCPYLAGELPESIRRHADRILTMLEQPGTVEQIARHPRLVGRFQEDVAVLASLPAVTARIHAHWGQPLKRLLWDDLSRLEEALERSGLGGAVAAYSAPYHYLWNALLPYWWTELAGAFCLFVQSPAGWFMPLLPLREGSVERPLREAFSLMRRWNGPSAVSRVENVPAASVADLTAMEYSPVPKDPDYVYSADALATLTGDRYKSQRSLCNRADRQGPIVVEPYHPRDRLECRQVFERWQAQKRSKAAGSYADALLEDSRSAHEVAWSHAAELNLSGSVLRSKGKLCGYTFGYWLDPKTWCVLLEVTDRTIPGAAQYLFRQSCRDALSKGAQFINTMDDSGLAGLRKSKEAYHPFARIESFACSEGARP
jgi:hypothetical protein